MKARLNITIDESLLNEVKQFAAQKNTSVSEMVASYFKIITKPKKTSFVDLLKELPKPNIAENFDWKAEYHQAKNKNYGL
jgi:hypothetical protein